MTEDSATAFLAECDAWWQWAAAASADDLEGWAKDPGPTRLGGAFTQAYSYRGQLLPVGIDLSEYQVQREPGPPPALSLGTEFPIDPCLGDRFRLLSIAGDTDFEWRGNAWVEVEHDLAGPEWTGPKGETGPQNQPGAIGVAGGRFPARPWGVHGSVTYDADSQTWRVDRPERLDYCVTWSDERNRWIQTEILTLYGDGGVEVFEVDVETGATRRIG
jgi:hypothetical protein